jgi:hypothetical protein
MGESGKAWPGFYVTAEALSMREQANPDADVPDKSGLDIPAFFL